MTIEPTGLTAEELTVADLTIKEVKTIGPQILKGNDLINELNDAVLADEAAHPWKRMVYRSPV